MCVSVDFLSHIDLDFCPQVKSRTEKKKKQEVVENLNLERSEMPDIFNSTSFEQLNATNLSFAVNFQGPDYHIPVIVKRVGTRKTALKHSLQTSFRHWQSSLHFDDKTTP